MKTTTLLKCLNLSVLTLALCNPAASMAQETAPRSGAAIEAKESKAEMTPDARKLLDQVQKAYNDLSAVQMSGKVSVHIDAGTTQEKTNQTFTSSFQAPNRFRHQVKEMLTIGSDGKQAYVFNESANAFARINAPADKVPMDQLPRVIPQILQTQNPSLLFALTTNSFQEVADSFGKVTKLEGEKIGGKTFPGLEFVSKENGGRMVMRIDPETHLIRQFVVDFSASLKESGAQDVNSATVTVDYSDITAKPVFAANHFEWSPPKDATDMLEGAGAQRDEPEPENGLAGRPAPDFTLPSLDGKKVSLSDLRGQVVVLDFWATWCPPCVKSLPMMAELYRENKDKGVTIYAINLREDKARVEAFLSEREIDIPVLLDADGSVAEKYNVEAIPQTVVISPDGRVQKVFTGFGSSTEESLRTTIQSFKPDEN